MQILLLDDQAVVRRGALEILREGYSHAIFHVAETITEAERVLQARPVDLALVEPGLASGEGEEALRGIVARYPALPVLAFSGLPEVPHASKALRLGARGFLPKTARARDLLNAVHRILEGERYVSQSVINALGAMLSAAPAARAEDLLSRRELQVAKALAQGQPLTKTARELQLSVKTVGTYRTRALAKLDLKTNAALARAAERLGLVEPSEAVLVAGRVPDVRR